MKYNRDKNRFKRFVKHTLSTPIIYGFSVVLVLFDLFVEIYHRICFPLYGIPYVSRKKHIRIDRHRLRYLKFFDKVNCAYCGYANGLASYVSAIFFETEQYWCGIKHKKYHENMPSKHKTYMDYGDNEKYKEFLKN